MFILILRLILACKVFDVKGLTFTQSMINGLSDDNRLKEEL